MESYSIEEVVRKYGSVSDFISRLLSDLEAEHGRRRAVRAGSLNSDYHDFNDGTTFKITAEYGYLYVEQVR